MSKKAKLDQRVKKLFRAIFPPKQSFYCAVCSQEKPLAKKVDFSVKGPEELCREAFAEDGLGGTWIPLSCCCADYQTWSRALQAEGFQVQAKIS